MRPVDRQNVLMCCVCVMFCVRKRCERKGNRRGLWSNIGDDARDRAFDFQVFRMFSLFAKN